MTADPPPAPVATRLRPWHWIVLDCAVVAVCAVGFAGSSGPPVAGGAPSDAGQGLMAATILAAAARRAWPVLTLVVVQVGACALALLGIGTVGFLAAAYVMYVVPLRVRRRYAIAALVAVATSTVASIAIGRPAPGGQDTLTGDMIVTSTVLIAAAWTIGLAVRQWRAYAHGLRDQAERRARSEVAQERLRVARELHDVVAHGMSLIAVQAGVANHVIGTRPEEAARALASIEATSRTALADMRRLLGVLRDGTGTRLDPELAPSPSLADLDELVAVAARAGVRVDLAVTGPVHEVPGGAGLAAYRIIQEALTNVARHAHTDASQVRVTYQDGELSLEVTDQGRGGTAAPGTGHGIVGMRERVSVYGGSLQTGPVTPHGFRVAARLPVPPEAMQRQAP